MNCRDRRGRAWAVLPPRQRRLQESRLRAYIDNIPHPDAPFRTPVLYVNAVPCLAAGSTFGTVFPPAP